MKTNNTREGKIQQGRCLLDKHFYPFPFSCCTLFFHTVQGGAFLAIGIAALFLTFDIHFTFTDSLPMGLYRSVSGTPTKGALVSICLPDDLAAIAKERGYGRPGHCPGGLAPLLKQVVAMSGDTVSVTDMGLTVNGIEIPNTARIRHDSQGREVPMVDSGVYRDGNSEIWLIANHSTRSWDSRYFGPLPLGRVQSVMKPLITWSN